MGLRRTNSGIFLGFIKKVFTNSGISLGFIKIVLPSIFYSFSLMFQELTKKILCKKIKIKILNDFFLNFFFQPG